MSLLGKTVRKFKKTIGYTESMDISEDDKTLLEFIRKCVELDAEATETQRELELDDLRFCDPNTQWSDQDRASRETNGRPVLTEDRLGPFLMQVCNEQRKNKPGVQVNPVDDSGDVDTAEVIQGLIRHIEYDSNADTAYDTAFESAVRCGRGFYRVTTEYVNHEGFEQEIKIKRIANPHSVFIDPSAQECDYSDAKWGGIKVWMSEADFKEQYPDCKMANIGTDAWKTIGDDAPDWMSKEGSACMVVEFYWKEAVKVTIEKDGKKREGIKTEVKWVKCSAVEVLERGEWASKLIPIIPVLGKEVTINGQRTYSGLIRAGKDPQKRHNYLLTAQVERIAFMPIATWVGAKGFMGKEKRTWARAHKDPIASLEFEIIGDDGQQINRPQLITEEAPIRAVTEAMQGAEEGMKAVLGMYDPSLGSREGAQSGLAIGRLQQQAETGNFHFQDNLSRALRYEGRIICELLPSVYDTERVIRIIGEDGTQKLTRINGPVQPGEEPTGKREAIGRAFDLTSGKYDVTVNAGPSYQSKRQEDRALLMGMLQGPMGQQIASAAPDLIASTLDSPVAKLLQERLKKLLPPQLQDQEEGQPEIPPQIQQQMQMMSQQHEQLVQALNQAQEQIASKDAEFQQNLAKIQADSQKAQLDAQTKLEIDRMDNETKMQIAQLQAETELIKTQATIDAKAAEERLTAELDALKASHDELMGVAQQMQQALSEKPEPEEEEEKPEKPDHYATALTGHSAALQAIAAAMHKMSAPKKIVMDKEGRAIGVTSEAD